MTIDWIWSWFRHQQLDAPFWFVFPQAEPQNTANIGIMLLLLTIALIYVVSEYEDCSDLQMTLETGKRFEFSNFCRILVWIALKYLRRSRWIFENELRSFEATLYWKRYLCPKNKGNSLHNLTRTCDLAIFDFLSHRNGIVNNATTNTLMTQSMWPVYSRWRSLPRQCPGVPIVSNV